MERICGGPHATIGTGLLVSRIVQSYFKRFRVNRAEDLSEEAQIRLRQDLDDLRQHLAVNNGRYIQLEKTRWDRKESWWSKIRHFFGRY